MSLSPEELAFRVERVLARKARKHMGLAVGVRHTGTTHTTGRGRVAGDRSNPPDERTIFEIGSITKVFTATLLADMARERLVALDDPVQKHLLDGVVVPVRGRPITLADLASHTSGLSRLPKGFLLPAMLRERRNPYASFTVDELHTAIQATKPRRAPGRKVRYSNYGVGLLGHALALRAGTSYEELVAERITGPLGMADTGVEVPEAKLPRFAEGHNRRGRAVPHWDLPSLAGAGALRSTIVDLLRFLDAQLGNAPGGPGRGDANHSGVTREARAAVRRARVDDACPFPGSRARSSGTTAAPAASAASPASSSRRRRRWSCSRTPRGTSTGSGWTSSRRSRDRLSTIADLVRPSR